MSQPQLFVGIDVTQAPLDIAVRPPGDRWAVSHDAAGIAPLVGRLQAIAPPLMVLDAPGESRMGQSSRRTGKPSTRGRGPMAKAPRLREDRRPKVPSERASCPRGTPWEAGARRRGRCMVDHGEGLKGLSRMR